MVTLYLDVATAVTTLQCTTACRTKASLDHPFGAATVLPTRPCVLYRKGSQDSMAAAALSSTSLTLVLGYFAALLRMPNFGYRSVISRSYNCEYKICLLTTCSAAAQVRAILTGALTMSDGTTLNTATELNAFVYNTIAGWCVLSEPMTRPPPALCACHVAQQCRGAVPRR